MAQLGVNRGFHKGDGGPASPPYSSGPLETDTQIVFNIPTVDSYKRYTLEENFARRPQTNGTLDGTYDTETVRIANRDFEVKGTGASNDDVTFAADVGGLQLETDTSASQQVVILPHEDADYSAWDQINWGTENQVIWEAVVRTGPSVASIILWGGLKLTFDQDITADNDQAFFRFDAGVANWETVVTVGGTGDVEFDTGVTVSADTNYYLKIAIDSDRKPHFYIDNKEVYVGAALTNDVDLTPFVGVEGNAKTLYFIKTKISRIIFE